MVTPKATPKAESMERRASSTGTPGQTVSSLLEKLNQKAWETESECLINRIRMLEKQNQIQIRKIISRIPTIQSGGKRGFYFLLIASVNPLHYYSHSYKKNCRHNYNYNDKV